MPVPSHRHIPAHLRSAEQVLSHYTGEEPFPLYLRAFFRANPKFGSRDRRVVSTLCYDSFRIGGSLPDTPVRERILAGHLLCADDPRPLIEVERPSWLPCLEGDLERRIDCLSSVQPGFDLRNLFPLPDELSADIDRHTFILSHLRQPDLFIRLRPRAMKSVRDRIENSGIPYRYIGDAAVALPNGTDTSRFGEPDRDFVIQDLSSQRTAGFMPEAAGLPSPSIWDACAGSGGKSLLAFDRFPRARIRATDTREAILTNLEGRFRSAGIRDYEASITDLTQTDNRKSGVGGRRFDLVIADVPCTGSGTWSRTPWEMRHIDLEVIEAYRKRQEAIVDGIVPFVKAGGYLLYITCSVYRTENDGMVEYIAGKHGLRLLRKGLIEGTLEHADTLFAALFTSSV
jgi:16S rRNA (cytosine967-C5)-methyltransferase